MDPAPTPRRICLADADAFFVLVAKLADPDGAGRADLLIVGGSAADRGVVCSASYGARAYGVRAGMPTAQAIRLCPEALVVPVPREMVRRKSREVAEVLHQWAPVVEQASPDEWFLDLSGTEHTVYRGESLGDTAARMRAAVLAATGITLSIGCGTSRTVAKMASALGKPNTGNARGVYEVHPGEEVVFMRRFGLADIPFVGPRFAERLRAIGLVRVEDALALDLPTCVQILGPRDGQWLYDRVRGIDPTPVSPDDTAKSVSREETFARDLVDDAALETALLRLVTRVAADLRATGAAARTVTVRLRDMDFTTRQASRTVPEPIETDRAIVTVARELLAKLRTARRCPARLLGVTLSSLAETEPAHQLGLFDHDPELRPLETERDRRMVRAVDTIRARFGDDAVIPAKLRSGRGDDGV